MSSILDQILNKGRETLPNSVGTAYDKVTKLGSWVSSGIEGYKTALQEWNQLQRYLKRWGNLAEDPQVLFYTINTLLRENPVKLPDHMSGQDMNMLRKLLGKIFKTSKGVPGSPFTLRDYLSDDQIVKIVADQKLHKPARSDENEVETLPDGRDPKSTHPVETLPDGRDPKSTHPVEKLPRDRNRHSVGTYKEEITDPYGNQQFTPTSPEQVIKILDDWGYKLGNQYVRGFEIGSISQWYIEMKPYISPERYSITPELPKYYLPNLGSSTPELTAYSFGNPCPVISWSLQYGTLQSEQIPLFNQASISIPNGFQYNMLLSLNILDDVYLSLDKYFRRYVNTIYKPFEGGMAPYWAGLFEITLTIFRPGYAINEKLSLICSPINWSPQYEGSSDNTNEHNLQVEFSVVGLRNYTSDNSRPYPNRLNMGDITWDQITLRQNK